MKMKGSIWSLSACRFQLKKVRHFGKITPSSIVANLGYRLFPKKVSGRAAFGQRRLRFLNGVAGRNASVANGEAKGVDRPSDRGEALTTVLEPSSFCGRGSGGR
jgi:hypothetical protein